MRLPNTFGFAAFILLFVSGCSNTHIFFKSDPLSASVIDAETGESVSGAVIVAIWELEKPRFFHGHDKMILRKDETETDQSGKFYLAAWGPSFVWPAWDMSGSSPYVIILKSGYKFEIASNYSNAFGGFTCPSSQFAEMTRGIPEHMNSLIITSWNSCQIKLQRRTESPKDYASRLSSLRYTICGEEREQCGNAVKEYFTAERLRLIELGVVPFYFNW